MIFDNFTSSSADDELENNDVDLVNKDPDTEEGIEAIAKEIEDNLQECALDNISFFEGGAECLKEFCESEEVQALVEARRMSKKTFVRLGKSDDLTRRSNMACLILARENKDPLFAKLAKNRVMERKLRGAIYKRYGAKALRIAKVSQKKHVKNMQKMKALPSITIR